MPIPESFPRQIYNFLPYYLQSMPGLFFVIILILLLPAVLFFLYYHGEGKSSVSLRMTYFLSVSLLSLAVLYWAGADFLKLFFRYSLTADGGLSGAEATPVNEFWLRSLSFRLAILIVILPVYAFHFLQPLSKSGALKDSRELRRYLVLVLVLSGFIFVVTAIPTLNTLINFIFGLSQAPLPSLGDILPYSVLAAMVWLWHFYLWKV